jgi:hypothetical protein
MDRHRPDFTEARRSAVLLPVLFIVVWVQLRYHLGQLEGA